MASICTRYRQRRLLPQPLSGFSADDAEAGDALYRLLPHVEPVDLGATRPQAGHLDQSFDVVQVALEHSLDAPIATVPNPAGNPVAQRRLPKGVPEGHALNEPVSYNTPPLHNHILRDPRVRCRSRSVHRTTRVGSQSRVASQVRSQRRSSL